MNLVERLRLVALRLEDAGFACDDHTAAALARAFASSTVPVAALVHWLKRTPEAAELLGETWPAKTSEPEREAGSAPGVAGASAPSITVTNTEAAAALAALGNLGKPAAARAGETLAAGFRTRPVRPDDANPEGLGVTTVQGLTAVSGADGKPLVAVLRIGRRSVACEFLDKRGPLILAREAGNARGSVVNVCAKHIEPAQRERVLAALSELPGADDEYNFDPFGDMRDPWEAAEQPEGAPSN